LHLSISFHGAVARTTGSAHMIEAGNKRILLDCGMIQGIPHHYNNNFSFDPKSLDDVILSHAHIDHSGRIPLLYKQGFEGSVYCTPATKDLVKILLLDAIKILKEEARRERKDRSRVQLEPLYDEEDVYESLKHFKTVSYHQNEDIDRKISFEFLDAGHILGSTQPIINVDGTIIAFTGDLGQNGQPLIRNPEAIPKAHYLITESTYGDRIHPPMGKAAQKLIEYAKHIYDEGGKLIIPAFAIGRTQNLVYFLNEVFENGTIDKMPVYIDSPMAIDATEIYLDHPECFDKETIQLLKSGDNPLKFPELKFSQTHHDSRQILNGWETCVVFAGSGMCTGGRILNHLLNELPTRKSIILFVGFQANGTLGREISDGANSVEIYDKNIKIKAKVKKIQGFSAHADKSELKDHIKKISKKPLKTFVVHGEAAQSLTFAAELRNTIGIWAKVPEYKKEYTLRLMD